MLAQINFCGWLGTLTGSAWGEQAMLIFSWKGDGSEMWDFLLFFEPILLLASHHWPEGAGAAAWLLQPSDLHWILVIFSGMGRLAASLYTVWYLFQWPLSGAIEVINRDSSNTNKCAQSLRDSFTLCHYSPIISDRLCVLLCSGWELHAHLGG